MNKYLVTGRLTIPRGIILALGGDQIKRRMNLLEPLPEILERDEPEEGFHLCRIKEAHVGFKVGEEFWIDETNGQIVGRNGERLQSEEGDARILRQVEIEEALEKELADKAEREASEKELADKLAKENPEKETAEKESTENKPKGKAKAKAKA